MGVPAPPLLPACRHSSFCKPNSPAVHAAAAAPAAASKHSARSAVRLGAVMARLQFCGGWPRGVKGCWDWDACPPDRWPSAAPPQSTQRMSPDAYYSQNWTVGNGFRVTGWAARSVLPVVRVRKTLQTQVLDRQSSGATLVDGGVSSGRVRNGNGGWTAGFKGPPGDSGSGRVPSGSVCKVPGDRGSSAC